MAEGPVCGVDEAGRGPLAGPVYAAAVILDPLRPIDGLLLVWMLLVLQREALAPFYATALLLAINQFSKQHRLVLRKLGKLITGRIRGEDTLSQHATAQFALLSPGIDRVSSCAFALRVRSSVEKLVMAYRDERIRVTLSIGVATRIPSALDQAVSLIEAADKSLYQSKNTGRDRISSPEAIS